MENLKQKIEHLLKISAVDAEYGFDSLTNKMSEQDAIIKEIKALAKAENTILGRTIKFPQADSYALYIITKVSKNRVTIDWVNYCDAWVDDRCGYRSTLDIRYAMQHVKGHDAMDELFSERKIDIL